MTALRIKSLRKRLGWTVSDLARRLGVQVEQVRKWEQGTGTIAKESRQELECLEKRAEGLSLRRAQQPKAEEFINKNNIAQAPYDDCIE